MVHVTIPNAIQSGRNAILTCNYELEDDDLYSVKWYKGKREFFRFTPKEIPSIKTFKLPGSPIRVDVSWFYISFHHFFGRPLCDSFFSHVSSLLIPFTHIFCIFFFFHTQLSTFSFGFSDFQLIELHSKRYLRFVH